MLIVYADMANTKPYVAVACVCEKVLLESDGVASLIRVVDTYHLQMPETAPELPTNVKAVVELTAFVSVKSGDVIGQHEIGLVLRMPDGKSTPRQKWPVVLNGGEHGANLKMDFRLPQPPQLGLYWFDVLWADDILTSIPFRLKLAEPKAKG